MIAFGPVPSRRLGKSVGINNIPPKFCSFSCVYCQLGSATKKQIERRPFYDPEDILKNIHLGREVDALRYLGIGKQLIVDRIRALRSKQRC